MDRRSVLCGCRRQDVKKTFTSDGYRVGADGKWAKGSWKKDSKGWWYEFADGYYYRDGWMTIKKVPYYSNSNGYLRVNAWIDNYYVNANGVRLKNTFTPDGYYVDADGKWDQTIPCKK